MTHKQLSDLMEVGAGIIPVAAIAQFTGCNTDGQAIACAIGCAYAAIGETRPGLHRMPRLNSAIGYDLQDTYVAASCVPDDVKAAIYTKHRRMIRDKYLALWDIITCTNDCISRRRAMDVTKELGY